MFCFIMYADGKASEWAVEKVVYGCIFSAAVAFAGQGLGTDAVSEAGHVSPFVAAETCAIDFAGNS